MKKSNILFIVAMWSLLVFVGYNVLTVEASQEETGECRSVTEPDDSFYCNDFDWEPYTPDRGSVEKMCGASGDYAKNPKNCDKAYDLVKKQEEKAAKEDAICDGEDADTTDVKGCMSEGRQSDKINEKICNKVDGKWTDKGGCETDHDGPKADRFHELQDETPGAIVYDQNSSNEEVIEDWGNTVSTDNEEQARNEVIKIMEESEPMDNYPITQEETKGDESDEQNEGDEPEQQQEGEPDDSESEEQEEEEEESSDEEDSSESSSEE